MELKQGLWKYTKHMDVLLYNGAGFYCNEDFLFAVDTLLLGEGWGIANMPNVPQRLKLPSHFIFNN